MTQETEMIDDDDLVAVKAAELYYVDQKTQGEIGELLNLTRWKVGRLISHARAQGYVRVEISHPRARRGLLELQLSERFGLRDAVVIPGLGDPDSPDLRRRVAEAAAEYLSAMRPVPRVLGISWGRTMDDLAVALRQGWANNVKVVHLNGGVSLSGRASSAASTAATVAQKAGGHATLLPSPAILEKLETKLAIEADRTVSHTLNLARSADTFLFSAGLVDPTSVLARNGYVTHDDLEELRRRGAVGDVLGRFVDADGSPVDPDLDARSVGVILDELREADRAIAVIAGESKHRICRTVVTSGLCSILVTDELSAQHLLDEALCE